VLSAAAILDAEEAAGAGAAGAAAAPVELASAARFIFSFNRWKQANWAVVSGMDRHRATSSGGGA